MRVVVLAKAPVAGRSKTRLMSRWTPEQTAALAEAALVDTLDTAGGLAVERHLVLQGEPGAWLPPGWVVTPQAPGALDARIHHALRACQGPTLLVGMDTPQVTRADLADGLARLSEHDACLGLAVDGGWWALGLAEPSRHAHLVLGVPTSQEDTGARQLHRLRAAGLGVALLRVLQDVDLPADAEAVASQVPDSRFGRLVAAL